MVKREIKLRREVSFVQPTRSFFTLYEGYRKSMKHELNMTYGIMVIIGSTWELPQTANYNLNITSLTKNWFCYDAHFKHQQAKRWILKRFVGVSQEEQVLNL